MMPFNDHLRCIRRERELKRNIRYFENFLGVFTMVMGAWLLLNGLLRGSLSDTVTGIAILAIVALVSSSR